MVADKTYSLEDFKDAIIIFEDSMTVEDVMTNGIGIRRITIDGEIEMIAPEDFNKPPDEVCGRCENITATWDDKKVGKCTHIETRLVRLEKQCEFKESKFKKKDGE
jgi:hypothetical protein